MDCGGPLNWIPCLTHKTRQVDTSKERTKPLTTPKCAKWSAYSTDAPLPSRWFLFVFYFNSRFSHNFSFISLCLYWWTIVCIWPHGCISNKLVVVVAVDVAGGWGAREGRGWRAGISFIAQTPWNKGLRPLLRQLIRAACEATEATHRIHEHAARIICTLAFEGL